VITVIADESILIDGIFLLFYDKKRQKYGKNFPVKREHLMC